MRRFSAVFLAMWHLREQLLASCLRDSLASFKDGAEAPHSKSPICHNLSVVPANLRLSDFKAVLFDIDGTLVDTLHVLVQGLGDAYERYNGHRPSNEEIRATIGVPLRVQLQMFRAGTPTEGELQDMIGYTISRFEANKRREREVGPAVASLVACKRAGYRTALVTSKNREEVDLFLARFEAAPYADAVVCASDVFHPKPHPQSVLLACERLGVAPSEALFIGDSTYDVECAHSAGAPCVGVAYGVTSYSELERRHPEMLFRTPEELLAWIKEFTEIPNAEKESCTAP